VTTPRTPPRAYPEQPPGGWTIDKIRTAVNQLETGYTIEPASRLTRACSRSAIYCQGRDQVIDTVTGLPLAIDAAGPSWEGRGQARTIADHTRGWIGALLAGGCERWLIELGEMMNLVVGVLAYDTSGELWHPVSLQRWPYNAIRLDANERRMWAIVKGDTEQEITPGLNGWVVYAPYGLWNWDAAMVRCIGEPWAQEAMGMRDLGTRSQADSLAVLDMPFPGSDMESAEATAYLTAGQEIQKGKGILVRPSSYPDPRVLDLAGKNGGKTAAESLSKAERRMIVSWTGQDGTTQDAGGSRAAKQVLNGVLYDKVEAHVSRLYGKLTEDQGHEPGLITSQVVRPTVALNWGRADLSPLITRKVPDLEEDARLLSEAERATAFRLEVSELLSGGWTLTPADVRDLAAQRGVRMPDKIEWTAAPPPADPNKQPAQEDAP
jgi:hypothetical protein